MSLLQHLRKIDPDARAFGLGYIVLLPLFLAPLFVTRFLPGLDLPFHLAMADMLGKSGLATDPYRDLYVGKVGLEPYAAHFIALRLLGHFWPLMTAHKIIVGLYVTTLPLALAALLGAARRSRLPALLALPLAYNLTLHYGFITFALSLPVLLILLAALARFLLAEEVRPSWAIATALAAAALFLCHLQNFLFGLCAAGALLLFSGVPWRRRWLGGATLIPAVGLLLRWHFSRSFEVGGEERKTLTFAWQSLRSERLGDMHGHSIVRDFALRFRDLAYHLLRGFVDEIDVVASCALLIILGTFVLLGILALFNRPDDADMPSHVPAPRLRIAGVIIFGGALVAYLGLPHHLRVYELMTFYPRFSVLLVLMGTLLVPGALLRFQGLSRVLLLVLPVMFGVLYGRQLIRHYQWYDTEVADFDAVLSRTPPGGRALGLVFDRSSRVMRIESAMVGMPNLYAALRPSPTAMVPIFYCGMRHMPCRRTEKGRLLPDPGPWGPNSLSPATAIDYFDYFFVRLPPARPIFGADIARLELLAQEGSWLVYRRKPVAPPPAALPAPVPPAGVTAPATAAAPVPTPAVRPVPADRPRAAGKPASKRSRP
jgi:hypothetical protein